MWTRGFVQRGINEMQTGCGPHHCRHIAASMKAANWALKCLSYSDLALIRLLFKHFLARDGQNQEASVLESQFPNFV